MARPSAKPTTPADEPELRLEELAERSGVPVRTIRLYITRGLLPRPLRSGPGAAYGPQHLAALQRIRELQGEGRTLLEIGQLLQEADAPYTPSSPRLPEPVAWLSFPLAEDVIVQIRADAHPWRLSRLRRLAAEFQSRLRSFESGPEGDDE